MNFKNNAKNIALWLIIALFLVAIFQFYHGSFKREDPLVAFSEFIQAVKNDQIKNVIQKDQDIKAVDKDGRVLLVHLPSFFDPAPLLLEKNVRYIVVRPDTSSSTFFTWLQILLPVLLLVGAWYFFFRQVQSNNGRALGFGRSRAKLLDPQKHTITFQDVAGVEEAKEDLKEIVAFLKDPERFQKIGCIIPKGVLLMGPPGTGKTLLAKAVAGEAGVPFFSISGSDFVEMFVGVGASRVRDLFAQAKQHAPCIIFIDEIDAVGRNRGGGLGGGHDEREQTLNQLLVEMDGFDPKEEVIVIAATNRSDVLDAALLRPGRFDRRIPVDLPDLKGRESILKVHLKKVRLADDVDALVIARGTPGFSGADLANLVNEGALLAGRYNRKVASAEDFESSRDKIIMGPERKSMIMTDQERKLVAYHEAGHAVVAFYSLHSDPIHKATIMPRGGALGMVIRLPEGDRVSMTKQRLMDDLGVAMGGRIAEEVIFGTDQVTTGASSDFKTATNIARRMVLEWGMSDVLGPISYAGSENQSFWGGKSKEHSEEIMKSIDKEIKKIIDHAYKSAEVILANHKSDLELVANCLLENETLTGDEIRTLLKEGYLVKKSAEKIIKKPRAASRLKKTGLLVSTPKVT